MQTSKEKMLYLLLHHNTMLHPSIDHYKFGIRKIHDIIYRLTKSKRTKKPSQNIKPQKTQEKIESAANASLDYYKNKERIDRIRNEEVQQRVKIALAKLKSKDQERQKKRIEDQKERIKFLGDNKEKKMDAAERVVKSNIATTKTQRKEARENLNKFYQPNDNMTYPAVGSINMCKYIPATQTTVKYFKTATFNKRTGKS